MQQHSAGHNSNSHNHHPLQTTIAAATGRHHSAEIRHSSPAAIFQQTALRSRKNYAASATAASDTSATESHRSPTRVNVAFHNNNDERSHVTINGGEIAPTPPCGSFLNLQSQMPFAYLQQVRRQRGRLAYLIFNIGLLLV
jgi:hypothetical protein